MNRFLSTIVRRTSKATSPNGFRILVLLFAFLLIFRYMIPLPAKSHKVMHNVDMLNNDEQDDNDDIIDANQLSMLELSQERETGESRESSANVLHTPAILPNKLRDNHNNPHTLLQSQIRKLATTNSPAGMQFAIIGHPHFAGGRDVIRYDLARRGFKQVPVPSRGGGDASEGGGGGPQMIVASCIMLGSSRRDASWFNKRTRLISVSLGERSKVLKRPFYWAVKAAAKRFGCATYTHVIPETFMVEFQPECQTFLKVLNESVGTDTMWFLKTRLESFGRGVRVVRSEPLLEELSSCSRRGDTNFLAQRGLGGSALRIEGRVTQGRGYLVIARYQPLLVFFFDGYVNVAPSDVATITNGLNNRSPRLLPWQLFSYLRSEREFNDDDIDVFRRKTKEAVLRAFLAVKDRLYLNASMGSYSIFGVDMIFHGPGKDLNVAILELNCNAELFSRPEVFGLSRVRTSRNLISNMHDVVLAGKNDPDGLYDALKTIIDGPDGENQLKDSRFSIDNEVRFGMNETKALELIYSESPAFSLVDGFCASS